MAREQLDPLREQLCIDYHLSFLHSQGGPELQYLWFGHLADYYQQTVPGFKEIASSFDTEGEWLVFDTVPQGHRPIDQDDADLASSNEAYRFVRAMRRDFVPGIPSDPQNRSDFLLHGIIARDIIYQQKQRFIGADKHASYFRKHVLLGGSTKRTSFDSLYMQLRKDLARTAVTPDLASLARQWEQNHYGQSFFQETVL